MHSQVPAAVLGCLPALAGHSFGSSWLAASQRAALPVQQLQQQPPTTQQQQQPPPTKQQEQHRCGTFSASGHKSSTRGSRTWSAQLLGTHAPQQACFHSSSHACSPAQQQQEDPSRQDGSSGGGNAGAGQQIPNMQQEAKEASRNMLTKSFDMEELWFAAVGGRLKAWGAQSHPELKGLEEKLVGKAKDAYYHTLQRAATGHLLSSRSRNQMKQACLAAATYKVIVDALPGSEATAQQFIADMMGGLYAPFMLGGLKVSSWVKRVLLRQSSVSQAVDTLHTIARDIEGACHCSVQPLSSGSDSEADDTSSAAAAAAAPDASTAEQQQQQQQLDAATEHEKEDEAEAKAAAEAAAQHHGQHQWQLGAALTVDSCLYADILKAEGTPQLLTSFCCQHNMSWLDTYSKQGVDSHLEACIAKGDGCCRITVTPK